MKEDEWPTHSLLEEILIPGTYGAPLSLLRRVFRRLGFWQTLKPRATDVSFLSQAIKAANVDAVLCHFAWTGIPVMLAIPEDMPLILHVHGRDVSSRMKGPAYRNALKKVLARSQVLIAVGAHQVERLRPLGLPERTRVIPCGAPLDLFASSQLPKQAENIPVQFISIGRMSPEKGMMDSLRAFELIADKITSSRLVLVGAGPEYTAITKAAAASAFSARIRLTGRLDATQIAEELASSHVYMQHSRSVGGAIEGFGVTLTEAGAAGLPLLASSVGGLVEQIVEGENGFLFPEGDISAQAALMLKLAGDAALRERLGTRARFMASRFDSARMTLDLEEEIVSAIRKGTR